VIVGKAISSAAKGSSVEMVAGKNRWPRTPWAPAGAEASTPANISTAAGNENWGVPARLQRRIMRLKSRFFPDCPEG